MITNDLIVNPSEMMQTVQEHQSFMSFNNIKQYLQANYYLPSNYSNTTFGVVAVADSIRSGHSRILQTILSQPDVQSILLEYNQEHEEFPGVRNDLESWNINHTIETLHSHYHFRLHLLHPVFSIMGWSDCLTQLFQSPDYVLRKAYEGVEEEEVRANFKQIQDYLVARKQTYLNKYSLKQLFREAKTIEVFVNEFKYYFNDDYSVADWLQGLIEVGFLNRINTIDY